MSMLNDDLNIFTFGVLDNKILLLTTKCEIFYFDLQELNTGQLKIQPEKAKLLNQTWNTLVNSPQFENIMKNFQHVFTMTYNGQSCLFLFGGQSGIMFNMETMTVTDLNHSHLFNDSVVLISYWDHQTFVVYYEQQLIMHRISSSNPITIESTTIRLLCVNTNAQIYSLDGKQCHSYKFTPTVKHGFITKDNVYLVGYFSDPLVYMVFIFNTNLLFVTNNPVPLTSKIAFDFLVEPRKLTTTFSPVRHSKTSTR